MNGGGPTAQIIEREGWKTDKDFVGHRKAITCVVRSTFTRVVLKQTPHVTYSKFFTEFQQQHVEKIIF